MFVGFGLYGVATLLLAGIVAAVDGMGSMRLSRVANVVVAIVGGSLVVRGLVLEVLLGMDTGGLRASIGPLESAWSLVLWNPWFVIGGGLFVWTALRVRRMRHRAHSSH